MTVETLDMVIDLKKMQVKWCKDTQDKLWITPSQNNDRVKKTHLNGFSQQAIKPIGSGNIPKKLIKKIKGVMTDSPVIPPGSTAFKWRSMNGNQEPTLE